MQSTSNAPVDTSVKAAELFFVPEETQLDVPLLKALAAKIGKPLTFYDLETTNFVAAPTFGVTDVGALHIYPDGRVMQQHTLVNPENPISPEAQAVTGISQDMVDHLPPWAYEARDYFAHWAQNHVIVGFNNLGFDDKGVISQNKRYGHEDISFQDSRDVRSFWRIFSSTAWWKQYMVDAQIDQDKEPRKRLGSNGRGKLTDIAAALRINLEGAHRAMNDVRGTALVLERMMKIMGPDFFDHPAGAMDASKSLETIWRQHSDAEGGHVGWINQEERIYHIIEQCGFTTMSRLMLMVGQNDFDVTKHLSNLVTEGLLDYRLIEDRDAQAWLHQRVPLVIDQAWRGRDRGRLKALFDALDAHKEEFPAYNGTKKYPFEYKARYIQMHVYLQSKGYYAAMDKSDVDAPADRYTPLISTSAGHAGDYAVSPEDYEADTTAPSKGGGLQKIQKPPVSKQSSPVSDLLGVPDDVLQTKGGLQSAKSAVQYKERVPDEVALS